MVRKLRWFIGVLALVAMFGFGGLSSAAQFPTKPIEIYDPFGAGGPIFNIVMAAGKVMSKELGQEITHIFVPGGGGMTSASRCLKAKPDGHTLTLVSNGGASIAPLINKNCPYKSSDFEFIAQCGTLVTGVLVKNDSPFKTLKEYIEYAKKNPRSIKCATFGGIGTSSHIVIELIKAETGGAELEMVPYKTSAELRTQVVGGHVGSSIYYGGGGGKFDPWVSAQEMGGRILGAASEKRMKAFPDIPTFKEQGINLVYSTWYGIAGPKNMPKEVSQKLKDVVYKAFKDPEVIKVIWETFIYEFRKSEEFTSLVEEYIKLHEKIIEKAKIPKVD